MTNGKKLFFAAIVFVICGLVLGVIGLMPPAELKTGSDIDLSNLDTNYAYYLEDMELLGEYASMSGDNGAGSYYVGMVVTMNDDIYLYSVYVDNDKEWKAEARDHNYSTITLPVPACYSVREVSAIDEDMARYYKSSARELIAGAPDLNVTDTGLHLRFVCNEVSEYEDAASNIILTYGGAVLLVLGIILFPVSAKIKKKEAEAAARAAEAAAAAAAYFNGEGAAPMYYDPSHDNTTSTNNGPEF